MRSNDPISALRDWSKLPCPSCELRPISGISVCMPELSAKRKIVYWRTLPRRGCIPKPRVAPSFEALPWEPANVIVPHRGFISLVLPGRTER